MLAVVGNERTKGVNSVGLCQCCEMLFHALDGLVFFAYLYYSLEMCVVLFWLIREKTSKIIRINKIKKIKPLLFLYFWSPFPKIASHSLSCLEMLNAGVFMSVPLQDSLHNKCYE